jgi:heat shock protein HspQ
VLQIDSVGLLSPVAPVNIVFASFSVGQVVRHKLFDYRGVIIDVDPQFLGTDQWYEKMAPSRPPKNKPWYKVLMHDTDSHVYVAERNLTADRSGDSITYPDLDDYFIDVAESCYVPRQRGN